MKIAEMIDVLSKAELKPNGDYANVEIYDEEFAKWMLCLAPSWDFFRNEYRIKPETKRVPLTQQDLIDRELSGKTMRVKHGIACMLIQDFNDELVFFSDDEFSYEQLTSLEWIDGTPCSKEVENG